MTPTTRPVLAWAIGISAGLIAVIAIGGLIGPIVGAFVVVGLQTLLVRVFEQHR